jgi:transcription initiation factor TFIID subunit 10
MSFQDTSTSQQGHAEYPIAPGGLAQPAPDNSQATPQASASGAGPSQPQSRQAAEEARKDRTLAEFMLMLDEYEPLVCPKMFMTRNDQH